MHRVFHKIPLITIKIEAPNFSTLGFRFLPAVRGAVLAVKRSVSRDQRAFSNTTIILNGQEEATALSLEF